MFLRIVLVCLFTTLCFSVAEATEIPSLGVNVESVTSQTAREKKLPVPTGSLILSIQKNSPAAKAGLKVGDIIIEVDGAPVVDAEALSQAIAGFKDGDKAEITRIRGRKDETTVRLTFSEIAFREKSVQTRGYYEERSEERSLAPEGGPPYSVVNLFYATDRNYTPSSNPAAMFGSDRGKITYGTCAVTIPRSHVTGELEGPAVVHLELSEDPTKHVILASATTLDAKSFYRDIAASLKRSQDKSAFVFVHGYNVAFRDAARRTAQMAHDLGYKGTPVFFSWPSQGKYLGYSYDEANIEFARGDLEQFIADFVQRTSADRIYLVGHSMGTRALTNALVNLFKDKPEIRSRITDIILAAPDIDADVFKRDIAPKITGTNQNVTLYASSRDWALRASKFFHGYERAGDSEPQVTIAPRLVTIDSSAIETDFFGHSYFAESESIIKDIVAIFSGKSDPSVRSYLIAKEIAAGKYWVMPGDKK